MRLFLSVFLFLCFISPVLAFSFQKKQPVQKTKMVETLEDWHTEAKNVPLEDRELKPQEEPKSDKKKYFPEPHYTFEKYNNPPGSRGYDIRFIKKNLVEHPIMVADINCKYVAYANYYYRADIDQIYSDFYVGKLDTKKTKTQRILDYNHRQLKRTPVLLSGFIEQYNHLFNGITLVDWSQDSNKILIKEQIGSTINGIYKTNIYVYFLKQDRIIKLSNFDNAIVNYYLDIKDVKLNHYRNEIEPLGFAADNDDLIIARYYVYDNEGKKIFLGLWGYDLEENKTMMLSSTNPSTSISANGLVLKRVIE